MPARPPSPSNGPATRERLLDAAEALFADQGHRASLRLITSAAGANLASVNYHFGSKEGLLRAVLGRRLDPINDARLALLDRFEEEAGQHDPPRPLSIERIVEAFVRPTLDPELDPGAHFMQLMAHLHASTEPMAERFFQEVFDPLVRRFQTCLLATLPGISPTRLHLRMHLLVGATIYALMSQLSPKCPLPEEIRETLAPDDLLAEVIAFCSAGFRHE